MVAGSTPAQIKLSFSFSTLESLSMLYDLHPKRLGMLDPAFAVNFWMFSRRAYRDVEAASPFNIENQHINSKLESADFITVRRMQSQSLKKLGVGNDQRQPSLPTLRGAMTRVHIASLVCSIPTPGRDISRHSGRLLPSSFCFCKLQSTTDF